MFHPVLCSTLFGGPIGYRRKGGLSGSVVLSGSKPSSVRKVLGTKEDDPDN